jgi:hypothetical protein
VNILHRIHAIREWLIAKFKKLVAAVPNPPPSDLINFDPKKVGEADVYRFLCSLFIHQDNLSWSRTQAILAIEGASLAGSLVLGNGGHGVLMRALLFFGSIALGLFWLLLYRDQIMRDHLLRKYLDRVHTQFHIRISPELRDFQRGRYIIAGIVVSLVLLNLIIMLTY